MRGRAVRCPIAVLVLVLAVAWPAAPAAAVEVWQFDESGVGVTDHSPGSVGTGVPPTATASNTRYYVFWTLGWSDAGWCRVRRWTTDPELADAYNYRLHRDLAAANAQGTAAECPATASPNAPPAPDTLARDFWDVRLLPTPQPHIAPDYAVTGKPVYLEIHGDQRMHFDVANPIGPAIAIETGSVYRVDWGDGTPPTTTTDQGGPWPHGTLTHTYTDAAATRTITVTQLWSATWSAGPAQGALQALQTAATLNLAVTQVQAVRN